MRRRATFDGAGERGTAAVEFAVVVVMLLVLAFGAIALTQVIYTHVQLANSVRAGARYAARSDYDRGGDPACPRESAPIDRRRTEGEVRCYTAEAGSAIGLRQSDVTVSTERGVPLQEATHVDHDDVVVVHAEKTVDNPVYALAASVTNALLGPFGGGPLPAHLSVAAEAAMPVE